MNILLVAGAAACWASIGPLMLLIPSKPSLGLFAMVRGLAIGLVFMLRVLHLRKKSSSEKEQSQFKGFLNNKLLFVGLMYASSAYFYMASLLLLPVSVATPLHYTTPIFLVLGTICLDKRGVSSKEKYGAWLALGGSLILAVSAGGGNIWGITLALLSALTWAAYLKGVNRLNLQHRNIAPLYGGIFLFLFGVPTYSCSFCDSYSSSILALLGIISSALPLLILSFVGNKLSATRISLILLLEPIFATLMAFVFNGQIPHFEEMLGILFILLGAAFAMI